MTGPRYAPADRMLTLVLELQATRIGLSISELKEKLGVERRTAERLLSALRNRSDIDLRPDSDHGGEKRWRIVNDKPLLSLDVQPDELAALQVATQQVDQSAMSFHADALRRLSAKLATATDVRRRATLESSALDLAAAEGLALRPGPREQIDQKLLGDLRNAILTVRKVELRYRYRGSGRVGRDVVRPYGFLHGTRSYLIAYSENEWARDVRQFALANMEAATLLEETFSKPRGWTLEKYARQSFGSYVEPPVSVVLLFSRVAAHEARCWLFHPTQKVSARRDGSLVVRFRAGGLREMAWHLVTWGEHVRVLAPKRLQKELLSACNQALVPLRSTGAP
jgi:predicted DNA-binding transcriptional regulator YafY